MKAKRQYHEFPALYDEKSTILILGSFPSVKSREAKFFYGHPQNRFWPMLGKVFKVDISNDIAERAKLLHSLHLAMYDAIESCVIEGSSDSSISGVIPADLSPILKTGKIKRIICNGKTAYRYFLAYQKTPADIEVICLPSTSPANAAWRLDDLIKEWEPKLR